MWGFINVEGVTHFLMKYCRGGRHLFFCQLFSQNIPPPDFYFLSAEILSVFSCPKSPIYASFPKIVPSELDVSL